ncbi:MAG: hypothetical protein AAB353_14690 [Candidatus Hydrogenedentota bacterium]
MSCFSATINDALCSVAACTVAFAAFFLFFTPAFQTVDDPVMMLIAAGGYGTGPSPLLIHSHVLIGWILSGMFSLSNSVNWYSLYLYAIHAVSACVILFCFLRSFGRAAGMAAWILLVALWILPFLLQLQFTTTAWMAGAASIALASYGPRANTRRLRASRTISVVLMVLAAMLRSYSLVLLVPVAAAALYGHRRSPRLRPFAITLAFAFLAAGAVVLTNQIPYRLGTEWDHYTEYAGLRVNYDRANFINPAVVGVLPKAGWSQNDFQILRAGLEFDDGIFSIAQLQALKDEAAALPWSSGEISRRLGEEARRYWRDFCIAVLCGLSLATMPRRNAREGVTATLLVAAVVVAMSAALVVWLKLPRRVVEPLLMGIALAPVFLPSDPVANHGVQQPARSRNITLAAVVVVLCALAVQNFASLRKTSLWYAGRNAKITAWVDAALADPARRDAVYISRALPLTWLPVFDGPAKLLRLKLIHAGWTTHTPIYQRRLASWGIDSIYSALLDRSNTYLIIHPQYETSVREFYREHRDTTVRLAEIERLRAGPNSDVAVYQIVRDESGVSR